MGKCLEDVLGATMKMVQWDLLGDPPGENGGKRDTKIGIVNNRKSGSAMGRGINCFGAWVI